MSSRGLLFLCVVLLLASPALGYDYFALAIQWGPSYCKVYGCFPYGDIRRWTIHGLWPTTIVQPYPAYCTDVTYSAAAISSIEGQLRTWWPSYSAGNDHNAFWEYEFEKHGSCSMSHAQLNTQYKYFERTLNLHSTYSVATVLANAGIVASDTKAYTLTQITNAFNSQWGVVPDFDCSTTGGKSYLVEIRPCFDKANLKPLNCGSLSTSDVAIEHPKEHHLISGPRVAQIQALKDLVAERIGEQQPKPEATLGACSSTFYIAYAY